MFCIFKETFPFPSEVIQEPLVEVSLLSKFNYEFCSCAVGQESTEVLEGFSCPITSQGTFCLTVFGLPS